MSAVTFAALAADLAASGAVGACAAEAVALDARARVEPREPRAQALGEGARGLRLAARLLGQLAPGARGATRFHPLGLRGAVAAGHLALAEGRPDDAEAIGAGVAEAAPRSACGLRLVGQALFAKGRFGLAVRALRGALAAAPDDPFTRALHAEALWFSGERIAARCALEVLLGARAGDPLASALDVALRSGALDGAGRAGRGGDRARDRT